LASATLASATLASATLASVAHTVSDATPHEELRDTVHDTGALAGDGVGTILGVSGNDELEGVEPIGV
jgi:hypothetical protein